jgi:hypothetical protein
MSIKIVFMSLRHVLKQPYCTGVTARSNQKLVAPHCRGGVFMIIETGGVEAGIEEKVIGSIELEGDSKVV